MARVSVVTGGSRGIGFAIARALAGVGDSVAILGTSREGVERAARVIQQSATGATGAANATGASSATGKTGAATGSVLPLVCDVRDAAAVDAAFAEVAQRLGGIDVLVNNAGVGVGAPVAELSTEEWNRILGINVTGVFHCCRSAIPHLRRRGGGWIISISSLASKNPFAGGAVYSASKAALNAFSDALMEEVRQENIRVSCILPGSVATEFSGRASSAGGDWRLHPEDIAEVVLDLLRHPDRSLPSRVEIRPSRPRRS